jgi:hypothetical protein
VSGISCDLHTSLWSASEVEVGQVMRMVQMQEAVRMAASCWAKLILVSISMHLPGLLEE